LKHGHDETLGTFAAIFCDWSDVAPFNVTYSISASELPDRTVGAIPMIVSVAGVPGASHPAQSAGSSSGD
jgi:hypothetical protein